MNLREAEEIKALWLKQQSGMKNVSPEERAQLQGDSNRAMTKEELEKLQSKTIAGMQNAYWPAYGQEGTKQDLSSESSK